MSMRAAAEGKPHYVVCPPLTCLPARRKRRRWTQHKTHRFTCSRLVLLFFLFHNFADIFFFFARDNAEVITAPSGTSTKHSVITKFSPLSKFTQYDGAQTTQVAHQWKGSLMWLQLPSVPMITNGGVCAALITHSAPQRNAVAEVLMSAHLQRR